jgi:hypothetical protein
VSVIPARKIKLFKKYDLHLVFGGIILISIFLMTFSDSREFGVNLFSEITSVAMTVFVIDKILERKERQKRISIDQRILREIQSIIASYLTIWKHLVWQYLPDEKIENESDLLRIYSTLVKKSSVNDRFEVVSIHHPESWKLFFHNRSIKECFENYYNTLSAEIQLFINDFKMYLEPELLDSLLNIMESEYFRNIYMMNQEGTEKILIDLGMDANRLESFLSADELGHLHKFFELMNYSTRLKNMISKFSELSVELYQVDKYFMNPSKFAL